MFPLQSLPKFGAKKDGGGSPTSSGASSPRIGTPQPGAHTSSNGHGPKQGPSAAAAAAAAAKPAALTPAMRAELQQQLSVLAEQEALVSGYVESASKARKFDDAQSLKRSLDELRKEIAGVRAKLGLV